MKIGAISSFSANRRADICAHIASLRSIANLTITVSATTVLLGNQGYCYSEEPFHIACSVGKHTRIVHSDYHLRILDKARDA